MARRVISYDQINPEGEETSSAQEVNLTGKRKQEADSDEYATMKYRNTGKLSKKQKKLLKKQEKEQISDNSDIEQDIGLNINSSVHKVQGPIKIEEVQYRIVSTIIGRYEKDPLFTNVNKETKLVVGVIQKLDQLVSSTPIEMKKNPFLTSELSQSENLSISEDDWGQFQTNFKNSFVALGKAHNENLQNFLLGLMQIKLDSGDAHEKLKHLENSKANKYQNEFQRLMLKKHEMIGNSIVTSLEEVKNLGHNPEDWIETCKDGLIPSNPQKIYAIDCEMCESSKGRELTRISIVNYNNEVVLDELVIPENEIIEYKTQYSGITEEILSKAKFTFKEIQAKILEIFSGGCILVGHAIMNDLTILKLIHPYIIDTSIIYQHTMGPPFLPSLKWLAKKYLKQDIQVVNGEKIGHDSIEDAAACIDLLKLKIRNGPHFGLTKNNSESVIEYLSRKAPDLKSALVGSDSRIHIYGNGSELIKSASAEQVLEDTQKAIIDNRFVAFYNSELNRVFNANKNENKLQEVEQVEEAGKDSSESNKASVDTEAVNSFIKKLNNFYQSLPSNTAVILLGGHSTNEEFNKLCQKKKNYNYRYNNAKMSEISDDEYFTDADSRRMRQLVEVCRMGLGFLAVKP